MTLMTQHDFKELLSQAQQCGLDFINELIEHNPLEFVQHLNKLSEEEKVNFAHLIAYDLSTQIEALIQNAKDSDDLKILAQIYRAFPDEKSALAAFTAAALSSTAENFVEQTFTMQAIAELSAFCQNEMKPSQLPESIAAFNAKVSTLSDWEYNNQAAFAYKVFLSDGQKAPRTPPQVSEPVTFPRRID